LYSHVLEFSEDLGKKHTYTHKHYYLDTSSLTLAIHTLKAIVSYWTPGSQMPLKFRDPGLVSSHNRLSWLNPSCSE